MGDIDFVAGVNSVQNKSIIRGPQIRNCRKLSIYLRLLLSFQSSRCKSQLPSLLILQPPLYLRTTTFKYNHRSGFPTDMELQGNASFANKGILLSTNRVDKFLYNSVGRALYAKPVRLWDSTTKDVANFSTRFSFLIKKKGNDDIIGDGLAFFLAPNGSTIPPVSFGRSLGLFSDIVVYNSSEKPAVAVEFDTFYDDEFDPYNSSSCHVGIDINTIKSVNTSEYECSFFLHNETNAWISYDSSTKYLSIHVSPASASNSPSLGNIFLSYSVDLKNILPEWVNVGFTAATGMASEINQILSWEFNWTELPSRANSIISPSPAPSLSMIQSVVRKPEHEQKTVTTKLVVGLAVGIPLFIFGVGMIMFMWQKKVNRKNGGQEIIFGMPTELPTDDEYELKGGPTKYSYSELVWATDDFKEDRKLGEGGFGSVYRGMLSDSNVQVAVKKISKESKQGKKEFASEVTIIGKLVHRNLVRLLGWCHERGDFLLVYEFLPNGSLDFHLFRGRSMLTWVLRYKIANDLASALLYLHEGWYQCVVHRDIKSSNILLDSDFNAKLGDFGLARLVDHADGLKTTMLGGTTGYIAPECFHTGKSSKESDIYSFGVVVLEIACGRRVLLLDEEENKVRLVSWVWELYASGRLLEAADMKLGLDFDEQQMERLMVVGLWCATYDYNIRPSIKQVSSILNMEAPLPDLTMKMTLSTHLMPSMQNHGFSPASSSSVATSYQCRTSCATHNTSSSQLIEMAKDSSYASFLHSVPR